MNLNDMAFPTIANTSTTHIGSDNTSHQINLSTSSVGNLIIIFFTCDQASVTISVDTGLSGSNWTKLNQTSSASNTSALFYKIAESSNALYITTDSSQQSTAISYTITNHGNTVPVYQVAYGDSININPPAVTPIYTTRDYLFLVYGGTDSNVVASMAPTNFSGLITVTGSTDGSSSSSAYRELARGMVSYDPGPFTSSAEQWVSYTVCIDPGIPTGIGINNIAYYNI